MEKNQSKSIPNFERIIRSKKFNRIMTFTNDNTKFIYVNINNRQGKDGIILKLNGFAGEPIKGKWTKKSFNQAVLQWYSNMWHGV